MSTAALMMEWGMPIEGREGKSVEVFMASIGWLTELKASDKIEDFRTYGAITGNHTERTGFVLIEGSATQIAELQESETWRRHVVRCVTVCKNLRVNSLEAGEAVTQRMHRFNAVTKDVLGRN